MINDDFAPSGKKASDLMIFEYKRGSISAHGHQDPPGIAEIESGCADESVGGSAVIFNSAADTDEADDNSPKRNLSSTAPYTLAAGGAVVIALAAAGWYGIGRLRRLRK